MAPDRHGKPNSCAHWSTEIRGRIGGFGFHAFGWDAQNQGMPIVRLSWNPQLVDVRRQSCPRPRWDKPRRGDDDG
jgi:hypothetical protein